MRSVKSRIYSSIMRQSVSIYVTSLSFNRLGAHLQQEERHVR